MPHGTPSPALREPPRVISSLSSLLFALALLLQPAPAAAQPAPCMGRWVPAEGEILNRSDVLAMTIWDADGPGGAAPWVVVGGRFHTMGGIAANNIAAWNTATGVWIPLGQGTNYHVKSLITWDHDNNPGTPRRLVVGGLFTTADGQPASGIAFWTGTTWLPLGAGVAPGEVIPVVNALAVLPNGHLVAAGQFTVAGAVAAMNIASWDGASWSPLGAGLSSVDNSIERLVVLPTGDLIASGRFTHSGAATMRNIARWNGASWSSIGSGSWTTVSGLAVLDNGNIIAAGRFHATDSTLPEAIWRWTGSNWTHLVAAGNSVVAGVNHILVVPGGDIFITGSFTSAGLVSARHIARLDGTSWAPLGSGFTVGALSSFGGPLVMLPSGDLIAGGRFHTAGGVDSDGIARWNPASSSWASMNPNAASVRAILSRPGGALFMVGDFSLTDTVLGRNAAIREANSWGFVQSGIDSTGYALAQYVTEGVTTIAAGGAFRHSDTRFPIPGIALYVGAWFGLSSGVSGGANPAVRALAPFGSGDLVVGGSFTTAGGSTRNNIAVWNGATFLPLGSGVGGGPSPRVNALAVLPGGNIIAAGHFATAGGAPASNIARFRVRDWFTLGSGTNGPIHALARLSTGELVAAGEFTAAGGAPAANIARWDGTSWHPLGSGLNGPVYALARLPSGDLVAGGSFTTAGGVSATNIARWNGASWSPLTPGLIGTVYALAVLTDGRLAVGGRFDLTVSFGNTTRHFGYWVQSCCHADWNNDHVVNSNDISAFLTSWLTSVQGATLAADFNADNTVNSNDISAFLTAWLSAIGGGC